MESHVSPFNKALNRTKPLLFCDVTLREGEQTPGVTFTLEEKLALAHELDEIGVGQIQIAHPKFSRQSLDVCKAVCAMEPRKFKTEIMSNGMWERVFEAIDKLNDYCNPDIIHSYFFGSRYQYANWTKQSKLDMLNRIEKVVAHIKSKGKICNISLLDATRTDDPKYLQEQIRTAVDAGANRVRLPDTVGTCDPDGYYKVVSMAVEIAEPKGVLVGIHTHNDFGLALANTLAGIRAGADLVDTTVNGLGDRAGNVDLIELVVLLEGFYGFHTGIDVKKLKSLSEFAEKIAGKKVHTAKPLTGEHVFSDESELHNLCMRDNPFAYQGILPASFGASRKTIFGKLTSDKVIDMVCERAGRTIDRALYPKIIDELYELADTHKNYVIDEAKFWALVETLTGPAQ